MRFYNFMIFFSFKNKSDWKKHFFKNKGNTLMIWGNSIPRMHCNVLLFLIATHSTTFVKFLKCSAGRKFVSRKNCYVMQPRQAFHSWGVWLTNKKRKLAEKARLQGRRKRLKPRLAPVYTDPKKKNGGVSMDKVASYV